ncbi:MAG TPA: GNAT family N-acetyltransferase [Gaiellaceae bacterium]|nr:GNAT family N-acetyltransferase [Gaiellaceae bacterium]
MDIRPATVDDAAEIAHVHVRTWQAAYEHVFGAERLGGINLERRTAAWQRALSEHPDEPSFVAEEDGRIVAFASVGPSRDAEGAGELFAIYALPVAWGSGAGQALMQAALDALREAAYTEAVLWVLEDNPRARRFYEREGWAVDGTQRAGEHMGVPTAEVRYRIDL